MKQQQQFQNHFPISPLLVTFSTPSLQSATRFEAGDGRWKGGGENDALPRLPATCSMGSREIRPGAQTPKWMTRRWNLSTGKQQSATRFDRDTTGRSTGDVWPDYTDSGAGIVARFYCFII